MMQCWQCYDAVVGAFEESLDDQFRSTNRYSLDGIHRLVANGEIFSDFWICQKIAKNINRIRRLN